ncbi:LAFE_0F14554g1_1 [Lachancea fermentati]|uniref:LAFE_0F14554g1_1 n=1 Tax=Lachancea fermentati TaxID=4955 RepID=A0A1G4MG34_LACFM|nr:LAFE_0F14554g1_1 [Lachancea fermentati]
MADTQGPLDMIPEDNYPPLITQANYLASKQMINQVLSEDQEYVAWKLKDLRTGGTMNSYLNDFLQSTQNSNEEEYGDGGQLEQEPWRNIGEFDGAELEAEQHPKNSKKISSKKVAKPQRINSVPKNLRFAREIYDEQIASLPHSRDLDQSEQLNLLLTNLDEEQMNRFEVFRRTSLAKNNVKKISSMVTNQTVAANIILLLAGVGKIFVGEIVEKALLIKKKSLVALMVRRFEEKQLGAYRLKKCLKKLTMMVESAEDAYDDSVDEEASDICEDEEDEEKVNECIKNTQLLRSTTNSEEIRKGIIRQYNSLVKKFNSLDVSIEKYSGGPLLPEHIREAWRLYRLENDTVPQATWRTQGDGNGWMFR